MTRGSPASLGVVLRARKGAWPWKEAVGIVLALGRELAAHEKAGRFPGPLTPDTVMLDGDQATLTVLAEGRALGQGTFSPLWTPPDQAEGAQWDEAANRYALGLVLYRLLAGEHPFAGAGLRHALDQAAHREAPPFREEVAAGLPAGLQSLCLRMIGVDGVGSAAEVVEGLEGFLGEPRPGRTRGQAPTPRTPPSEPEAEATGRRAEASGVPGRARSLALASRSLPLPVRKGGAQPSRYWPLAAGAVVLIASLAVIFASPAPAGVPSRNTAAVTVPPEAPLSQTKTAASDCASCHPRQAAEWRRSVMAHSVKSPLFNALEILIEEQAGKDDDCPNGAGVLRRASSATACRVGQTGNAVTGSGGEHWCVNCHSPAEKLSTAVPPWEGRAGGDSRSRLPVRDLLADRAMEGISCAFCHEVHGPVPAHADARGGYEGNATWTSFVTGTTFLARPEDGRGLAGIGNSGYDLRPADFLIGRAGAGDGSVGAHLRPPRASKAYLRSSEFCGSCHDVRLFGTDVIGKGRGEHFKRLRNAYSEWVAWAAGETRAGRPASTCQDCHMSTFPGVCVPDEGSVADAECPKGFRFSPRDPGALPKGRVATASGAPVDVVTHWFSGVDVPLSRELPPELIDEPTVDLDGVPLSARRRRDMLLKRALRFALGGARRGGLGIEIPVEIENVGAGHRVPAGFSQEREIWVHLTVRDGDGRTLYEVGRVDRGDEDLHDKVFVRVNVRGDDRDGKGRPLGVFGADVRDGSDVPLWQPPPALGGTAFRGKGLVNFQNGFFRCVRCLGTIAADGHCEAGPGQTETRAERFADGDYDLDTGECRSNLSGQNALFETYFPVGSLDASRGIAKGPDAIVDTRSLPPHVPMRYVYDLSTGGRRGPFKVEARLLFRAFPPFLIKAFAAYEREQARRGLRPSGPLVSEDMLGRLEVVELARAEAEVR